MDPKLFHWTMQAMPAVRGLCAQNKAQNLDAAKTRAGIQTFLIKIAKDRQKEAMPEVPDSTEP